MTDSTIETRAAPTRVKDLPAPGYPVSEEAVDHWFRQHHGRAPTEQEVGAIMSLMAEREATLPHEGPRAQADGWVVGPATPPTRRVT